MKLSVRLYRTGRILAAAAAAGCAMISSAHAAVVTHVFSGIVTQVGASSATLGNAVTATLVYDSEQTPTFSAPPNVAYFGEFDLSLVTTGFSTSTNGGNMLVFNDYTDDPGGAPVDAFGANGNDVFLYLIDPSMNAFASNTLPTALTLSDFLTAEIAVIFGPGDSNRFIASLTSVDTTIGAPAEVPLPAAFWMMALGLGALGRYSQRKLGSLLTNPHQLLPAFSKQ